MASGKTLATTGAGWYTITFDTPYVVSGSGDNLVVTLHRFSPYSSTRPSFATHNTDGYKTLHNRNDDPINITSPMTPSGNAAHATSRPNIRFVGTCNVECIGANLLAAGSDVSSVDL